MKSFLNMTDNSVMRIAATAGLAGVLQILTGCALNSNTHYSLIKDNHPTAVFILPAQAPESVALDIDDFNADLKHVAGAELPIRAAASGGSGEIILDLKPAELMHDDQFEITFPSGEIMQIHASPRSLKWALNYILEEYAGVRWLFPGEHGTHWPQRADIAVPRRAVKKTASFPLQRNLSYPVKNWQINLNAKDELHFNHELTVFAFPLERYGSDQSWPADIMPVVRGEKKTSVDVKKARGHWQPCYSNPKTVEVAVENICDWLENHPETRSIGLAVNDSGGFCECGQCLAAAGEKKRNSVNMPHYSEVYFKWANQVAALVSAKYPDIYFGCLAYREVLEPPSFDLHPRIVPFLCFDIYSCLDPQVRENRLELMREWHEKTRSAQWGHWDYSYSRPRFLMPRIYFGLQQDIMRQMHQYGARAMFVEAYPHAGDGPGKYLCLKLMWDVNADIGALLDDWYQACVGEKSAPFLKEYFQKWEDIWMSDDMKSTTWFIEGKNGTYLHPAPGDYACALKPGDLAKFRELMEQVAANTRTPAQTERAAILMREWEFVELSAQAYNAEKISPHGSLDSAEQAAALVRDLPNALACAEKRKALFETDQFKFNKARGQPDFTPFIFEKLNLAAVYIDSVQVQTAVAELIANTNIPQQLRTQAETMLRMASDEPMENIFADGTLPPFGSRPASDVSFRGHVSTVTRLKGDRAVITNRPAVSPETNYMFSARILIPTNGVSGSVEVWMVPHNSKSGRDGKYKVAPYPGFRLIPGRWTMVCSALTTPPDTDTIIIYLLYRGLDGQSVYIADSKLTSFK